jgi:YVTN family beta-propeller protein
MKLRICRPLAIAAFVSCFLASAQTFAQNAYITNFIDDTVSVISTATNTVTATIPVGGFPLGVAVTTATRKTPAGG